MKLDLYFEIGNVVYSRLGGHRGIVTGLQIRPSGTSYIVTWSHDLQERFHYDFELSRDCTFDLGPEHDTVTQ